MTDYDSELRILHEKLSRKAKVESMLSSLSGQLGDLKAEEQRLAKLLMDEQADVERLEKPSLASFFYTVINQKAEKLDKEKAEAYAASIKHDAAVRQVKALEYDISALQAELSGLSGVAAQYNKLFAQKTAAVKVSNPKYAEELCRIKERLLERSTQSKEIDEALSVGRSALSQISVIEGELHSAEGWGTWDLFGGGLISNLAKHSHLDDAQAQINELQVILRRYHTELSDVKIQTDIQAQVEGFLRFADYFFDGLLADWAVLDRIHSAQKQISDTRSQIEHIQSQLAELKRELAAATERQKAQLSDIVLKASVGES